MNKKSKQKSSKRLSFFKKLILSILLVFTILIFLGLGLLYGVINHYQKGLPSISKLEEYEPPLKTKLYAETGELLYEYYEENRILLPVQEIPPSIINTVIATEDARFWQHWGIDVIGIMRAIIKNVRAGKLTQGASTITQQLARTLFLTRERTLERKIREAILAFRIERNYTKQEILGLRLNQVYLGEGAYGVEAAALTYFDKHIYQLSLQECAVLSGLQANTMVYSPFKNPRAAKYRRSIVLRLVHESGYASRKDTEKLKFTNIIHSPKKVRRNDAPYFIEEVRQQLEKKYGSDKLYRGGLIVYTTLDYELQKSANINLEKGLLEVEDRHKFEVERGKIEADTSSMVIAREGNIKTRYVQGALVSLETNTGKIKAMVGGRDYYDSKWNRAVQARKQPGSAFKPFVYATAIDRGYNPSDVVIDAPIVISVKGELWKPSNYDRKFYGPTILRDGLRASRNIISIKLAKQIGAQHIVNTASKMGITTPLGADLSLAVGSYEVHPIEMAAAFAVFPSGGVRSEPYAIMKVEDRDGLILEENVPIQTDALNEQTAYIMVNMMEDVINRGTGIGARARGFKHPAGGETGTTNSFTDAWFVGYTQYYTTAVWVGFDEKDVLGDVIPGVYNNDGKPKCRNGEAGGRAALPIWTWFMLDAHKGLEQKPFKVPNGIIQRRICTESGQLATDKCPQTYIEVYVAGQEPSEPCPIHQKSRYDKPPIELWEFENPEDGGI